MTPIKFCFQGFMARRKSARPLNGVLTKTVTTFEGDIEVTIDVDEIVRQNAQRALASAGKQRRMMHGAVLIKAKNVRKSQVTEVDKK